MVDLSEIGDPRGVVPFSEGGLEDVGDGCVAGAFGCGESVQFGRGVERQMGCAALGKFGERDRGEGVVEIKVVNGDSGGLNKGESRSTSVLQVGVSAG